MEPEPHRHLGTEAEIQLLRAFIVPDKRDRFIGLARSKRRRQEFLRELDHFRHFDPRWIRNLKTDQNSPDGLIRELRRLGAVDECSVISVDPDWDGRTGPLDSVVGLIYGGVEGTIVSCVPSTLAYYEGEGPFNRFILHRDR